MSVDFKIRDFLYPASIIKLRLFLEKSQWFTEEMLREYQFKRLMIILDHAYRKVPYYRRMFDKEGIRVKDVKQLEDIERIPHLTKDMVKDNFESLQAVDIENYGPQLNRTTGTTGEPVNFFLDKTSNILEFCYYWRYWSWAGYSIYTPFAEFSLHHFLGKKDGLMDYSHMTRRLTLNPAQMSYDRIDDFVDIIRKYKPVFLKGSPSTIYMFALLTRRRGHELSFKAVFTTGELVIPSHRETIEKTFKCTLIDSYGHMERTVAVSQCPEKSYHINSEYGIMEVMENPKLSSRHKRVGNVLGTSLHNFAMPLIRYEIGDLVGIKRKDTGCGCGRGLPVCDEILGRKQNILVTPDGRFLTNIFILFNELVGIRWVQIIQESIDEIRVDLIEGGDYQPSSEERFLRTLKDLVGDGMHVTVDHLDGDELPKKRANKYIPVISRINIEREYQ
ncbi:MAG: hypothetical protein ABIH11_02190 [Candidatus Altiarchaeota archaeon]